MPVGIIYSRLAHNRVIYSKENTNPIFKRNKFFLKIVVVNPRAHPISCITINVTRLITILIDPRIVHSLAKSALAATTAVLILNASTSTPVGFRLLDIPHVRVEGVTRLGRTVVEAYSLQYFDSNVHF